MDACNRASRAIEVGNPDLRTTFFIREKREAPPIRCPARAVAVLVGNEDAFAWAKRGCPSSAWLSPQRHDPYVRRLLVRGQVHIHRAEQHPLAIRRWHRLANALQLHHVFESEGMPGLRKGGKRKKQNEKKNKTPHDVPPKVKNQKSN